MTLEFRKECFKTVIRDPRDNFELKDVASEARFDPITGELSRVFPFKQFKLEPHDWTKVAEASRGGCPFCPGAVEKVTPQFPVELIPEGRLSFGKAVVVPNLSPYAPYSGVTILGREHYLALADIPADIIVDGLSAGISFLKRVKEYDPNQGRFGAFGWNYMPFAGGSIIHPHIHVLAGPVPGNTQRALLESSAEYLAHNGENGWDRLVKLEKQANERYLWQSGSLHWLTTFAPRGLGDITVVFEGKSTLQDLTFEDLQQFAGGLQTIFRYYASINLSGFNLALYPAPESTPGYWLTARIVGRFRIFNLTSDISSIQMLHGDYISVVSPEQIALEINALL